MKVHPTRGGFRTLALITGCVMVGTVAGPAVSTATEKIQEVFVTNTADTPVPVAAQGTTEVTGTVTVANQPEPPAPPAQPLQKRFGNVGISREQPFASGIVYEVPEGKILTVEYGQAYFAKFGSAELRRAELFIGCQPSSEQDPINRVTAHLPEFTSGDSTVTTGGPLKLHVPGGRCLRYSVGAVHDTINEGTTIIVHGFVTGYLSDAPAS